MTRNVAASVRQRLLNYARAGGRPSRMKDFYDIWLLAIHFDFDGS